MENTNKPENPEHVEMDVGQLLISDFNKVNLKPKSNWEKVLTSTTRDNVQLLVNQIWTLPAKCIEEVIVTDLPKPTYVLPRSRKVPNPKALTKWEQFAKEKGIQKKKKGKSKLQWDDILKKWIPTHGYKKVEAEKTNEWCIEYKEGDDTDPREALKKAKTEKVAKNELQRLRNLAKSKNIKVPKVGVLNTVSAKDPKLLEYGAKVAEVSTASLGKFSEKPPRKTDGKVTKAKNKLKKKKKNTTGRNPGRAGKAPETASSKKPKAGKGNRDFRKKVGGRKRRN
ncbi:hypothetical protein TKK_0006434 [Trichogramma kaykai]|uniref:Ribosome biogenesis regulatory protein n=1 Tax=Trichogramma kaykai TaxID=54128 RepID=A0ABD2XDR8_9HYME